MSWLATKYAWKCRDERVKGSVRLVLLAIAMRVRNRSVSTIPTDLSTLRRLTFLSDDQVRRCLDTLESIGEVHRVRRGKRAIYSLPKMAGPLFVETPQDAAFFDVNLRTDAAIPSRKMPDFVGDSAASDNALVRTSEEVRTSTTTSASTHRDEAAGAAEAFLDWFISEHRRRRDGRSYPLRRDSALMVIRELLDGRGLERLQAMTLRMFEERRDEFIRTSDLSIHVLRHKAVYLEDLVAADEQPDEYGHYPRCRTWQECRDRALREAREEAAATAERAS